MQRAVARVTILTGLVFLAGCLSSGPGGSLLEIPSLEDLLAPLHPDEPLEYTLGVRFSAENAVQRLGQIGELGDQLGLTGEPEMALANWLLAVEGTVRRQELEIRRLELELADRRHAGGEVPGEELDRREAAFRDALESFQDFWESCRIVD
ncbi:MAG: hypothetical protein RDU89_05630 [bacterium]|nr:hypothetical protein [bacterium]